MATVKITDGIIHSTGAFCLSGGTGGNHLIAHNDYICATNLCTTCLNISDSMIIQGDLTVHGTCSILNTTVCTTSAMSITNAGTGPALVVNQTGSQPVVNLQDDGISVFYIEDGGNVGIGTTNPVTPLDICDSIASGVVCTQLTLRTYNPDFIGACGGNGILFKNQDSNNATNEGCILAITRNDSAFGDNDEANTSFVFRMTDGGVAQDNVIFTGDGRVGIGTTNPSSALTVAGDARLGDGNKIYLYTSNSANYLAYNKWQVQTSTALAINNDGTGGFQIQDSGSPVIFVGTDTTYGGRVGINTVTPSAMFSVCNGEISLGSSSSYTSHFNYQDTGTHYISMANSGCTYFRDSSGNTRMTIQGAGNVGIGSAVPTSALDITGTGVAALPTLRLNNTSSSAFIHSLEACAPNLTSGQTNLLVVGKAACTKNSGYLGYYWTSNASNSNFVSIGHWGSDHRLRVYADGMTCATCALCTGGNIVAGSCLAVAGGNSGYLRDITGQYGSIEVTGGATGGWDGYSIGGRMVFMHNGDTATGIYNDVDNEWLFYGLRNADVRLYYNGVAKLCTMSTGICTGDVYICSSTNSWNGGLQMLSQDGTDLYCIHPDNNGYMYVNKNWCFNDGDLKFGKSNPYLCASSYIVMPGGLYVSGGTAYFSNRTMHRGGICNDSGAWLCITGGTAGDTSFGGNVGIGTTNPSSKLHIVNSANSAFLVNTGAGTGYTYLKSTNTGGEFLLGINRSDGVLFSSGLAYATSLGTTGSTALQFHTNNSPRVTVDTSGNVGIGTSSPSAKLDVCGTGTVFSVNGTNGTLFSVEDDLSDSLMSVNDAAGLPVLEVFADSSVCAGRYGCSDFYIASGGNVGIGTTSPTAKLDIVGDGADFFLQSDDFKIARIQPRGTGANLDKGLLSLFDGSTEDVRIDTAGNSWFTGGDVGIGTANPQQTLFVQPATDVNFGISNSGTALRLNALNNAASVNVPMEFTGSRFSFLTGSVGIGTTDPGSCKLVAVGDIKACDGWFRTTGQRGWYSDTYFGGIYMTDTNYMRFYNSKSLNMCNANIHYVNELHFYNNLRFCDTGNDNTLYLCSGNASAVRLDLGTQTTRRGSIYADSSNQVGFLDQGGHWAIKHCNDNFTGFYTNDETLRACIGQTQSSFCTGLAVCHDWNNGNHHEQLTVRGTYPSFALRNTSCNGSVWLFHHHSTTGELQFYGAPLGCGANSTGWTKRMCLSQTGVLYVDSAVHAQVFYDRNNTNCYVDPSGRSVINALNACCLNNYFGTGTWDYVGATGLTNLNMNGHNYFWFGAGNGTWFTGTANSKSQASGLAADASKAHDLLITTMYSDASFDRGVTFAAEAAGNKNSGWRLGKWHAGDARDASKLVVDGQLFAKGGYTDEYDYYADDYSTYYSTQGGTSQWTGDSGYGWNVPGIVASTAIQIQSSNGGTSSRKPQLQFHQFGYGGPAIEYDGPNDALCIIGPSTRLSNTGFKYQGNTIWHAGNDGAGSGLDADLLDGQSCAYYRNASNLNAGTYPDLFSSTTRYNIGLIDGHNGSSRDKLRVWNSSSYAIGMQSGITFGSLGDYAMTFQMNDDNDRGFWWGDTAHTTAQGAMSLTTQGFLTVAERIRVGAGQSCTGGPGYQLQVDGCAYISSNVYVPHNIYHIGDTDTYYGFHGANHWRVVTGGSERIEIRDAETVINDSALNHDFRVETQVPGYLGNDNYALFVDASQGAVGIGTSQPSYALEVNGTAFVTGTFSAGTKNFLIDHPTKENYMLRHGSLEGPENAVYVRGTTTSSSIELPEYWTGLVDEDTITATLTPRGKYLQLFLDRVEDNEIHVGGTEIGELYDYVIYGTRKDVEDLIVEFERPVGS